MPAHPSSGPAAARQRLRQMRVAVPSNSEGDGLPQLVQRRRRGDTESPMNPRNDAVVAYEYQHYASHQKKLQPLGEIENVIAPGIVHDIPESIDLPTPEEPPAPPLSPSLSPSLSKGKKMMQCSVVQEKWCCGTLPALVIDWGDDKDDTQNGRMKGTIRNATSLQHSEETLGSGTTTSRSRISDEENKSAEPQRLSYVRSRRSRGSKGSSNNESHDPSYPSIQNSPSRRSELTMPTFFREQEKNMHSDGAAIGDNLPKRFAIPPISTKQSEVTTPTFFKELRGIPHVEEVREPSHTGGIDSVEDKNELPPDLADRRRTLPKADRIYQGTVMINNKTSDVYKGDLIPGFGSGRRSKPQPHGHGIVQHADKSGDMVGWWEFGQLRRVKDGYASVRDEDGNEYIGTFAKWKKHGNGTLVMTSGEKYVGGWSNDLKHGFGVLTFPDGTSYEGMFKNDKPRQAAPSTRLPEADGNLEMDSVYPSKEKKKKKNRKALDPGFMIMPAHQMNTIKEPMVE